MKKSLEIVEQLKRYFNAKVIGSQLFVDAGLLSESETNDIDIAVSMSKETRVIHKFLEDQGFTGEDFFSWDSKAYKQLISRTKYSSPEYDKIIDLNYFKTIPGIYTIPELVMAKFEQGRKQDLHQLFEVLLKKGGTDMQELSALYQQYKENQNTESSE